jgi:hypothetical protein
LCGGDAMDGGGRRHARDGVLPELDGGADKWGHPVSERRESGVPIRDFAKLGCGPLLGLG